MSESERSAAQAGLRAIGAVPEHVGVGAQEILVVENLDHGNIRPPELVPGGDGPSGDVVDPSHVGTESVQYLADQGAGEGVASVERVPEQALPGGRLVSMVEVEVPMPATEDSETIHRFFADSGIGPKRRDCHLVASFLEQERLAAKDHLRSAHDMGVEQGVQEQDLHEARRGSRPIRAGSWPETTA